ncbi:class 3 adenylate cyclase [Bosea psychrotolerans]|uniref:Class 3 adenylate cyclase n=2 Tax=Bosea psychrotolerans TaxID=1871628 RepID=A0A2S4MQ71_9HYPH|nr:class 3 adenylate cyclase [Bosea psychrotolerans]
MAFVTITARRGSGEARTGALFHRAGLPVPGAGGDPAHRVGGGAFARDGRRASSVLGSCVGNGRRVDPTGSSPASDLPANAFMRKPVWVDPGTLSCQHSGKLELSLAAMNAMARDARAERGRESLVAKMQRHLAAILSADVVGYTRLSEAAEEATHHRLMSLRASLIDPCVREHGGRIVKHTGDGFLATFDSAPAAASCALSLQRALTAATADQPAALRIAFRMGINLADIILDNDDIFGDGVNVAARLQSYAEAGDVIVSEGVFEKVDEATKSLGFDMGEIFLRNHERPVRVFALRPGPGALPTRKIGESHAGTDARASIAILPFRVNSTRSGKSFVADGVVDSIIHSLSGHKELFVISRGSTLQYGQRRIDPVTVGRKLGVRYVMDGAVSLSNGRIRISTELIANENGAVVSADHYDGKMSELFDLQDRISLKLATTIAPHIRERELRRTLRKHPQNLTGYDLLLQARDLLYKMDADSFARAGGLLQQAMALDPSYAPPFTYAALWHVFRVGELGSPDPDGDARAAAERALAAIERDGNDALALAIYGHVQAFLLRDTVTAQRFLDRAIDAGPSVAMAWTMSSATRGFVGNGPLAVLHGEQGQRLAPADPYRFWHEGILAQAHYISGDYDQAIDWARSAVAHNPSIRFTLRTLAASLAAAGRQAEAASAADRLLLLQPDFRLTSYAPRCPFVPSILEPWIGHLRRAGLPD